MNRRRFLAFLPALPVALLQGYPAYSTPEPVTLETLDERMNEVETGVFFASAFTRGHEIRLRALERCALDCGIRPDVKGDI